VVWKDKRDVCLLTNIHNPPREGNYRDEHGNAIKPAIVADYNRHMGHVDSTDRMANSYTASLRIWKWTKKLFFHMLDLANLYILLSSCGGTKISHRDFRLALIREMLAWPGHDPRPSMPVERPASASNNTGRLDTRHNKHWPGRSNTKRRCRLCSVGAWSERWYWDVSSVVWRFLLIETVLKITIQRPTCKTSIRPSSVKTVEASTAM